MINRENLKKWTDALRSGKYTQGKRSLCTPQGYCCLGVLCEVAIENGVPLEKRSTGSLEFKKSFSYDSSSKFLPDKVLTWIGEDLDQTMLAAMNDTYNKTFSEIADYLDTL